MTGEKKKQFLFHDLTILWLPIDNLLIKSRKFGGKSYYCYSGVLLYRCFVIQVFFVLGFQRDGEPRFESCDLQYFAQQTEGFS